MSLSSTSERAALSGVLHRLDFFRRSPSRLGGPGGHKEWQHFMVHAGDLHLLINFNLLDDPWASDPRQAETARLIVLARSGSAWHGGVDRFAPAEVEVMPGRVEARFGDNLLGLADGAYRVRVALASGEVAADLELVPLTSPTLASNRPLTRERRLSWLFVPRLVAHGRVTIAGRELAVAGAPAYHDHNWGHFLWGEDFAWQFGSALPDDPQQPCAAVFWHVLDRARNRSRSQGLHLRLGEDQASVFRDEELRISCEGAWSGPAPLTLPPVMAMLAAGTASDVPEHFTVHARGPAGEATLRFVAAAAARVVVPVETAAEGTVALNEVCGRAALSARLRGQRLEVEGPGVFEFVRA